MIRRLLARAILRLIGPELDAEMKRIASAEASYAGAVALTIGERKLTEAVLKLTEHDQGILAFARQTEVIVSDVVGFLEQRAGSLPGETKPGAFEVIPPKKLN